MDTDKEKKIIFYKEEILRLRKKLDEHLELEKKINLSQIKIKDFEQIIWNTEQEILKLCPKKQIECSIMQNKIIFADLLLSIKNY